MATEYIKREDALNAIRKSPISNMGTRIFCIDAIADIPAADVVEKKYGHWRKMNMACYGGGTICEYECSVCEEHQITRSNFCPNCGAWMRGDSDV